MTGRPRTLASWSSGKDSAWMAHVLRTHDEYDVAGLLTTYNSDAQRGSMHGVRLELIAQQARALGLPLRAVPLPFPCSNADYDARMRDAVQSAVGDGFTHVAFGDLFLEDVREYREQRLTGTGMTPVFPLWGRPTRTLAEEMIAGGLKARLSSVDPRVLDRRFAGAAFDALLLAELPADVDPCGERGEFHTFVWDGPMFSAPIPIVIGETIERDGFVYTDFSRRQDCSPALQEAVSPVAPGFSLTDLQD